MMDLDRIRELIELMEETGVAELEIREGEQSVRINRGAVAAVAPLAPASPAPAAAAQAPSEAPTTVAPSGHVLRAPMVGTFYRSPSPNAPVFTDTGQRVREGDVLCIIESMKMMNEIKADRAGVIEAVLVGNSESVEFDQPLFAILDD